MSGETGASGAFRPTPQQQLLLQACLLDGAAAIDAWRAWRAAVDIDLLDIGSIRLLPMLAEMLARHGIDDAAFGKYRGVQRRTWARNRVLHRSAAHLITALEGAGVRTMALKGLALATTYYPADSMRPMGDIDLMVDRDDVFTSMAVMERTGWRAVERRPADFDEAADLYSVAYDLIANPDVQVDVHWRLLYARFSDAAEAAAWTAAEPLTIDGVATLAPCAADLLLHVCAHGARWNPVPPVRWVVDAAMLLRSGKVDWPHLLRQTERRRLGLPLCHTLNYLREALALDIPSDVIAALQAQPSSGIDRLLYRADQQPYATRSLLSLVRVHAHIAREELVRRHGIAGYWRYFAALRAQRSVRQTMGWVGERLTRGARG